MKHTLVRAALAIGLILAAAPRVVAYEGDHYVWTYYLALQLGYTPRQAFQVASGTYAIDWDPDTGDVEALKNSLTEGLSAYRSDYAAYYSRCKRPDSPPMRDSNPTVILIPGLGMVAWGKNKSESRMTAEFYNCAIEVMRGAEAIDEYTALPLQEAFDIEYWLLEEAKLQRMPPEQELARYQRICAHVAASFKPTASP